MRIYRQPERKLSAVPLPVLIALLLALAAQGGLRYHSASPQPSLEALPTLPDNRVIQSAFLGDGVLAARLLSLWLQARDTQSGSLVANRQRNYQTLSQWLSQLQALDQRSGYSLMLAARVYSQVSDPQRMRHMLDTVNQLFLRQPEHYWRWQAEAAVLAKHRLGNKELALHYAQNLAKHTPAQVLPYWARDMQVILLQDLGRQAELELLVGGLITSGQVTDATELQWLNKQLTGQQ